MPLCGLTPLEACRVNDDYENINVRSKLKLRKELVLVCLLTLVTLMTLLLLM